eukprot:2834133-Pyramimonas_sp.AAC.1
MGAALIVFAQIQCRRLIDPEVLATDASTGGATGSGGFGVVSRRWEAVDVVSATRVSESWRFSVDEAISARQHALGTVGDSVSSKTAFDKAERRRRRGTTSFTQLTEVDVGVEEDWKLLVK